MSTMLGFNTLSETPISAFKSIGQFYIGSTNIICSSNLISSGNSTGHLKTSNANVICIFNLISNSKVIHTGNTRLVEAYAQLR